MTKIDYEQPNSKKKWNALIWASCKNYPDIVRLLLEKGASN